MFKAGVGKRFGDGDWALSRKGGGIEGTQRPFAITVP